MLVQRHLRDYRDRRGPIWKDPAGFFPCWCCPAKRLWKFDKDAGTITWKRVTRQIILGCAETDIYLITYDSTDGKVRFEQWDTDGNQLDELNLTDDAAYTTVGAPTASQFTWMDSRESLDFIWFGHGVQITDPTFGAVVYMTGLEISSLSIQFVEDFPDASNTLGASRQRIVTVSDGAWALSGAVLLEFRMQKWDTSGPVGTAIEFGGGGGAAIQSDPDDNIYVAFTGFGNSRVYRKYNSAGVQQYSKTIDHGESVSALGIGIDSSGNWGVTYTDQSKKLDMSGAGAEAWTVNDYGQPGVENADDFFILNPVSETTKENIRRAASADGSAEWETAYTPADKWKTFTDASGHPYVYR